nr:unnamed protein product [Callosobruchus analis]
MLKKHLCHHIRNCEIQSKGKSNNRMVIAKSNAILNDVFEKKLSSLEPNECHLRQRTVGNPSRPSPSPQQWSNNFQRPPQPSQPVQTNQTGSSNQFPQRQSVIRPNYSVPQRNTVLQQNPNFNYYQRNPKPTSNYPPRVNHVNPHYDDNIFEQADGFYEIDNFELTADDNDASETDDYPMDSYYEPQPQEYRDDTPQEVNFQNDPLLDRPPLELFEDMSEMVMDEVYPRAHSPQDELPLALIEDMSEMTMLDDEPSPQKLKFHGGCS